MAVERAAARHPAQPRVRQLKDRPLPRDRGCAGRVAKAELVGAVAELMLKMDAIGTLEEKT